MVIRKGAVEFSYAGEFVGRVFGAELHAKRVQSLTNATVGVMTAASLAVSTIGHGLALAHGSLSKHAIKQVDRLLSNPGIDVKELFMRWVPSVVGRGLGWQGWTHADPAWRRRNRRGFSCGGGGLRPGQGYERAVVSGDEPGR